MDQSVFRQAIDKAFPKLDEQLRSEIYQRVLEHIFENLKNKVFINDADGLQDFQQAVKDEQDNKKQAQLYVKKILEKLVALPIDKQKEINRELTVELNRVMKEIYKAYERK